MICIFDLRSNLIPDALRVKRSENMLISPSLFGLGLDHIFIPLGPTPITPPSLPGLPARTCVGTFPRWESMLKYPVKITNI